MKRTRNNAANNNPDGMLFNAAPDAESAQEDHNSALKKRAKRSKNAMDNALEQGSLFATVAPQEPSLFAQPLQPQHDQEQVQEQVNVEQQRANFDSQSSDVAASNAEEENLSVDANAMTPPSQSQERPQETTKTLDEQEVYDAENNLNPEESQKTVPPQPVLNDANANNNNVPTVATIKPAQVSPRTVAPDASVVRSSRPKPSAYQVVARRYRPQGFAELIGQENVARALSNAIETDRVGHAYLFTGARGVGKTSCARIFAKSLNCVHGPTSTPCLVCDSCVRIASGEDVDVIEIDGASNRGVDEIRQLRQNAAIAPTRSLYKIYIIDEVHMLTREAFNALLKTLEEPPARVKFIFCTTEPNKIPITILSRCQRFDFNTINGGSIAQRLRQIAQQEGATAEDAVFDLLARRANGSMRDAQSLLEQLLSFAPNNISIEDAHKMLGAVDDVAVFQLLETIALGEPAPIFALTDKAARSGVDFGVLLEQISGLFRDLMVVASGCAADALLYTSMARLPDLQRIANQFGLRRIIASLQILDQAAQRLQFSSQTRVIVELALVRLTRLDAFQAIESLIIQLKQSQPVRLNPSNDADGANDLGAQKKNKL
ncbi:MAG: DNA polymerase III subunit gamma/tau [Planctomycetia bacterium]|nr:DNA polymerase III subunit gamma/tau [Planctomycetia bacterium]